MPEHPKNRSAGRRIVENCCDEINEALRTYPFLIETRLKKLIVWNDIRGDNELLSICDQVIPFSDLALCIDRSRATDIPAIFRMPHSRFYQGHSSKEAMPQGRQRTGRFCRVRPSIETDPKQHRRCRPPPPRAAGVHTLSPLLSTERRSSAGGFIPASQLRCFNHGRFYRCARKGDVTYGTVSWNSPVSMGAGFDRWSKTCRCVEAPVGGSRASQTINVDEARHWQIARAEALCGQQSFELPRRSEEPRAGYCLALLATARPTQVCAPAALVCSAAHFGHAGARQAVRNATVRPRAAVSGGPTTRRQMAQPRATISTLSRGFVTPSIITETTVWKLPSPV